MDHEQKLNRGEPPGLYYLLADPYLMLRSLTHFNREKSPQLDGGDDAHFYIRAVTFALTLVPISERGSALSGSFEHAIVSRIHARPDEQCSIDEDSRLNRVTKSLSESWKNTHPNSIAATEISKRGSMTSLRAHALFALEMVCELDEKV